MPNGTTLSPMDMEMVDLGYPDQGYTPDHAYAPAPTPDVSPDGRIQQQRGTIPLADLPPMPTPDYATKRSESYVGIAVVLVIIAACLGGTYGAALATPDLPRGVLWLVLWLVSLEAVAAIGMLLGILFADPGTIKRSQETCFPIPESILEQVEAGEKPPVNVTEGPCTYCVRCMVWRPPDPDWEDPNKDPNDPVKGATGTDRGQSKTCGGVAKQLPCHKPYHDYCEENCPDMRGNTHHCSICQRCVRDFDHHCGVFGRCIAGSGFQGNMCYFKSILVLALLGILTTVGTVTACLVIHFT